MKNIQRKFSSKKFVILFLYQADVDIAVEAASKAFKRGSEWRSLDASARGKLLHK